MSRYSRGSVSAAVRGWIHHYRELQLAERVLFMTWSAALVATLLGLVGVSAYQGVTVAVQSETCAVRSVSPTYSTLQGRQYEVVDTSCGKYQIHPGDSATSALDSVSTDSLALTGSPSSAARYVLTFRGWGSERQLVGARSH